MKEEQRFEPKLVFRQVQRDQTDSGVSFKKLSLVPPIGVVTTDGKFTNANLTHNSNKKLLSASKLHLRLYLD